jgi:hypothetical protein
MLVDFKFLVSFVIEITLAYYNKLNVNSYNSILTDAYHPWLLEKMALCQNVIMSALVINMTFVTLFHVLIPPIPFFSFFTEQEPLEDHLVQCFIKINFPN